MVTAIVLSAGSGRRMGTEVKKQYLLICSKPIIWHTLRAFEMSDVDEVILVVGRDDIATTEKIIEDGNFAKVKKIVEGGKERQDSVYNGLKETDNSEYVLIHDGARPLITPEMVNRCIEEVKAQKAIVAAVPVKDTIKIVDNDNKVVDTPDRKTLWSIQTPQAFSYELIRGAFDKMIASEVKVMVTDDAMVVEKYSDQKVSVVMGEYTNIKITTPEDIILAEKILKKFEKSVDTLEV